MALGAFDIRKYDRVLSMNFTKSMGKVINVVGLTIESAGPSAKMGDLCRIYKEGRTGDFIMAEVVGFKNKHTLLMPYEATDRIGGGCIVECEGEPLSVPVGDDLLGKTLDGLGRPTDGTELNCIQSYPIDAPAPDAMKREIIDTILPLGVKAVDGLITVGKGQRIGIFAGSGVGKSTLMGMFARNTKADINVIALIGERGREVREFILVKVNCRK